MGTFYGPLIVHVDKVWLLINTFLYILPHMPYWNVD